MSEAHERPARSWPTMADVGAEAGVSAQTVSRYFTGGYVGNATRGRIEEAIESLGYRHNRIARSMRAQRSHTVGVLAMGPFNFGNTSIMTGLSRVAKEAGLSTIIAQLDVDVESVDGRLDVERALDNFVSFRVDGIIVATPFIGIVKHLERAAKAVPAISLSRSAETAGFATIDSYAAAAGATRHLVEQGHRRIIHLVGPLRYHEAVERLHGFDDVMAAAALPAPARYDCADWTAASGADAARRVEIDSFDAVVAANDELALGFLRVMADRGRVAPTDFSIVGIDDMPEAEYFWPRLTTMRMEFETLGETALELLVRRLETGDAQEGRILTPSLVVRDSTRPARG
ncbi:LacI family DNA-binding transcriptional regulator [Marisediminicola sp. LYQ85]|uniref:LacI family DNA-binding transcriptional regulator n=1 Tax=Marisediminicola sp. LYQ85 TaxID=3391062 RepID=UPI00398330C4